MQYGLQMTLFKQQPDFTINLLLLSVKQNVDRFISDKNTKRFSIRTLKNWIKILFICIIQDVILISYYIKIKKNLMKMLIMNLLIHI